MARPHSRFKASVWYIEYNYQEDVPKPLRISEHLPIFALMKPRLLLIVALSLLLSCARTPSPEPFLTPEFEQVLLDEHVPGEVTITCRMSSMEQITECGMYYTADLEQPEEKWRGESGTRVGEDSFAVALKDLSPGATYTYRLFIGNGRTRTSSARNYYTVPE